MEQKLTKLFDFQRFSGSRRLATVIDDVESRYAGALSDDDLEMVSAAGEAIVAPGIQDETMLIIPIIQAEGEQP